MAQDNEDKMNIFYLRVSTINFENDFFFETILVVNTLSFKSLGLVHFFFRFLIVLCSSRFKWSRRIQ